MRSLKGGVEIDKYKKSGGCKIFFAAPNFRKMLKKAFPMPDLRCEAALDSVNLCTNMEGIREAVISSTLP